jgi:hypothetical protein
VVDDTELAATYTYKPIKNQWMYPRSSMADDDQILKCRDDKSPVVLSRQPAGAGTETAFSLAEGSSCSWLEKGEAITPEKLRPRIEPWLTALFQSEHFSLLVGSGLTHALHLMAVGKALPGMSPGKFTNYENAINAEAKRSAESAGRQEGNIEDQLRTANELLRGLEIVAAADAKLQEKADLLRSDLTKVLADFAASILAGERGLITADDKKLENTVNYLVSFLMSFASRTGTRDRLQVFTTNYDRCLEMGSELAGLHLIDRFVGSIAPIFRSSRLDVDMHYNPPGIRGEPRYLEGVARFTKLHGSVDWVHTAKSIRRAGVPFGALSVAPYLEAPGLKGAEALQLMIYPNAAKDRETAAYPYVELFRDLAAAVCRPNSTLISFGYSFGDEHINRVIEDMLTIPSSHLVIISYGDPLGRIMETYERLGRHAQITLLIGNHLGDFQSLVDNYLPKPAIDRTTFRMAELLKARWGAAQDSAKADSSATLTEEGGEE